MSSYKINEKLFYNPYERQLVYCQHADGNTGLIENTPKLDNLKAVRSYSKEHSFCSDGGIFLTNKCPLNCRYCFYETGSDGATLSQNQIDLYLRYLVKNSLMKKMVFKSSTEICKLFISGGGEPTNSPELLKFCINRFKELCSKCELQSEIAIITNGICDKEILKFLADNVQTICISYDGNTSAQNRNRKTKAGYGSDEIVRDSIAYLDSLNCKYCIRTTVGEEDSQYLIDMFDNIYKSFNNVEMWQVECIFKVGRGVQCEVSDFEFADNYLKLLEYSNTKPFKFQITNSVLSYTIKDNLCPSAKGTSIWLDAYGNIVGCANRTDYQKFGMGYVSEKEIRWTGNSDVRFDEYEKRMLKCCENCYAFAHCCGGCPHIMQRDDNGKYVSKDSELICNSVKHYWNVFLERLFEKKRYAGYRLVENSDLSLNNMRVYDILIETKE